MRKALLVLLTAALVAMFSGCCSYTISKEGGHDTIYIQNVGWKLLCCLPIASGDPEYPNEEVSVWFCDSVLLEVNMMILDNAMTKHGYKSLKNLTSHRTDETAFPILLKRYTYQTSAELIK